MREEHPLWAEIQAGESKSLEFKVTLPGKSHIAKTAIAFANTSGGKILLGVNDQRHIVGLGDADIFELQDRVAAMIADACAPALLPTIYTVNLSGHLVLVIEVFRGSALPYFLKKEGPEQGVYVRIGATTRRADPTHIQELTRQRLNRSFDEETCFEFELADLDLSPLKARYAALDLPCEAPQLRNLKLVNSEQGVLRPTQGLVHLLGLPDHAVIQCARFKGTDMSLFIDRKTYTGDLFSQLEAAEQFLWNHLPLRGEIKGLQRTDTLEIPPAALREALVNALVHRDYTRQGSNIKVAVFDDRVMIVSPGTLPHGLSTAHFQAGRSELRNRTLARVFKTLGLIEQWGSGFQRMQAACLNQGLRAPDASETDAFFEVVFWRPSDTGSEKVSDGSEKSSEKTSDGSEKSSEKVSDGSEKTSDSSEKILQLLAKDAELTIAELAKRLNLSTRAIEKQLKKLQAEQRLARVGPAKGGHWKVLAPGPQ